MSMLSRQEIPLERPGYRVDGQVAELFFPYGEIPDFSSPDRIALALVLTHDGEVLYTLPDRVISCLRLRSAGQLPLGAVTSSAASRSAPCTY